MLSKLFTCTVTLFVLLENLMHYRRPLPSRFRIPLQLSYWGGGAMYLFKKYPLVNQGSGFSATLTNQR